MSTTFVRESFYVLPPKKGATPEAWEQWLKEDRKAAINAKRAFTRSQDACDLPESAQETSMRKVGGVWKQTTSIALTGSVEDGSATLEPVVDANQENDYVRARFDISNRGAENVLRGNSRRAAKRAARKARKAGK
jgi:hypothetical protein